MVTLAIGAWTLVNLLMLLGLGGSAAYEWLRGKPLAAKEREAASAADKRSTERWEKVYKIYGDIQEKEAARTQRRELHATTMETARHRDMLEMLTRLSGLKSKQFREMLAATTYRGKRGDVEADAMQQMLMGFEPATTRSWPGEAEILQGLEAAGGPNIPGMGGAGGLGGLLGVGAGELPGGEMGAAAPTDLRELQAVLAMATRMNPDGPYADLGPIGLV